MEDRHYGLNQLRVIPTNERQLQPFTNDIYRNRVVDPGAEVMVASIVPDLRQYLKASGGVNFRDPEIFKQVDQLRYSASASERGRLNEWLQTASKFRSLLLCWRFRHCGSWRGHLRDSLRYLCCGYLRGGSLGRGSLG